eukprot:CAMPEP_0184655188 /NCGR_PEP_ID=MMETSP0308-20130426/12809_1 /TAXON_ID=38269 /ORGANISM="Gloeochaete witrockiana, Strain SAG 46.84" /LENGTH=429 /DNA_ID=CAMNT_0027091511 /DNA_START=134 /DNA_END=1423 /DNA_ORIENTATION=+
MSPAPGFRLSFLSPILMPQSAAFVVKHGNARLCSFSRRGNSTSRARSRRTWSYDTAVFDITAEQHAVTPEKNIEAKPAAAFKTETQELRSDWKDSEWNTVASFSESPNAWDTLCVQKEAVKRGGATNAETSLLVKRLASDGWLRGLLTIPKSQTLKAISFQVWSVTVVSAALAVLNIYYPLPQLSSTPHFLLSTALGLLLVFQTDAAYSHYSEARKNWGLIINRTRDIGRSCADGVGKSPELRKLMEQLIRLSIAFAISLKQHLRRERSLDELRGIIASSDIDEIQQSRHMPLYVTEKMTRILRKAEERELLSQWRIVKLDEQISHLVDMIGSSERIIKTPVPLSYRRHTSRFLMIWLLTLPIVIMHEFTFASIPIMFSVSYALLGIEELGAQIEQPFEKGPNDLPLQRLCDQLVKTDLLDILTHLSKD